MTTVEKILTTTRSVRKRLDLSRDVPLDIVEKCLDLATQAPTGSNSQQWRFVLVTDPNKRAEMAALYARSFQLYAKESAAAAPKLEPTDPRAQRMMKVVTSAVYLSENLAKALSLFRPVWKAGWRRPWCSNKRLSMGPYSRQPGPL